MNTTMTGRRKKRLILTVEKARELMAHDPISIPATATVKEAAAVLIDKGISAAAVVDVVGRLVGVFSQSDVLLHTGTNWIRRRLYLNTINRLI